MKPTIGIIGGSGLYSMPGFEAQEERPIETPWGAPSDPYCVGRLAGKDVAFLARHGRGHRISPSELNFRANIYGFKSLGVERILSLSAVGSLREEHQPLDFAETTDLSPFLNRRNLFVGHADMLRRGNVLSPFVDRTAIFRGAQDRDFAQPRIELDLSKERITQFAAYREDTLGVGHHPLNVEYVRSERQHLQYFG